MNPFKKRIPSVFSIETPFQALCAIAAIKQLEIEDYKFLVFFPPYEARNAQLRIVLKDFGIKYKEIKPFNRITFRLAKWLALKKHRTHYNRLFIGDFRDINLYYTSLRFVTDGADVVYLDDGSVTISLLKDIINEPMEKDAISFLKEVEYKRSIVSNKNFLTIYDKIENPKYRTMLLDLCLIRPQLHNERKNSGIFIVGTNIDRYCAPLEISNDVYIAKLDELIRKLKRDYPDEQVVFIPHGRDKSEYAKVICERYGASFEPSETTIELKLLDLQSSPKVVYGFTSSALYNIKKMFPHTEVVNIVYECEKSTPFFQEYLTISNYYLQNGIELLMEPLQ